MRAPAAAACPPPPAGCPTAPRRPAVDLHQYMSQSEAPLLTPNVLICSVGTEIFYRQAGHWWTRGAVLMVQFHQLIDSPCHFPAPTPPFAPVATLLHDSTQLTRLKIILCLSPQPLGLLHGVIRPGSHSSGCGGFRPLQAWRQHLDNDGWDRCAVMRIASAWHPCLKLQVGKPCQGPYCMS